MIGQAKNNTETNQAQETVSPLDTLCELMDDDMRAVNTVIMARMQSDVSLIPQLASYLIAAGGKRLRPLLTVACARLCGHDGKRAPALAAAVEFIHTASLLHDDVVDESDQRRGQKAANLIFGNKPSVLVGDFLFSKAFQLMVEDGSLEVLRVLSNASAVITEGEVLQLSTLNNIDTRKEDYFKIVKAKTAALFAAACEVGAHVEEDENAAQALHAYGLNLGIAFQIIDDVLDYSAQRQSLGKDIGDDFREGKMTLPVLYALDADKDFWARVIGEHDQRDGDLEHAVALMQDTRALEHCIEDARAYAGMAIKAIESLEKNHHLSAILIQIANFTVDRKF